MKFQQVSITNCLSCDRYLSFHNGSIAFEGGIPKDTNNSMNFEISCSAGAYHHSCIPQDAHHSIRLEHLKSEMDALYWTHKYNLEPWFQNSNWWPLITNMFNIHP